MSKGKVNTDMLLAIVFAALAVLWAAVIFGFSSQNGDSSTSLSREAAKVIVKTFDLDTDVYQLEHYVRKCAHFCEYGIFASLIFGSAAFMLRALGKSPFAAVFISTVICLVYAASDEFHQGFVDGRSPEVKDVLIDTGGGLTAGVFICVIMLLVYRKRKASAHFRKEAA